MEEKITLTEREKICSNCGGILEVVETSQETWVLEGKEYRIKNFFLQCLQCRKKYLLRKSQDETISITKSDRWEV